MAIRIDDMGRRRRTSLGRVGEIALWALALGSLSCATPSPPAAPPGGGAGDPPMRIDERHNATEEAVQPGETLEIVLGENRSSGFRWRLLADGAPVLRLEKDQYHAAAQPLGAPGQHTWLMQVQTVGDATVELAYSRGWQEGQPARRFNVRVKSRSP